MTVDATSVLGARATEHRSPIGGALRGILKFAKRKPLGAFGGLVLLALIFAAIFANVISPYGVLEQNTGAALEPPSLQIGRAHV